MTIKSWSPERSSKLKDLEERYNETECRLFKCSKCDNVAYFRVKDNTTFLIQKYPYLCTVCIRKLPEELKQEFYYKISNKLDRLIMA